MANGGEFVGLFNKSKRTERYVCAVLARKGPEKLIILRWHDLFAGRH